MSCSWMLCRPSQVDPTSGTSAILVQDVPPAEAMCQVNWARLHCARATTTSRWSHDPSEDPNNVLDGTFATWWSSEDVDFSRVPSVKLTIDLGAPRFVERILIFWGDDKGRTRAPSRHFTVSVACPTEMRGTRPAPPQFKHIYREKDHDETVDALAAHRLGVTYCEIMVPPRALLVSRQNRHQLQGIQYVEVDMLETPIKWCNHAISQIQAWGTPTQHELDRIRGDFRTMGPECFHGSSSPFSLFSPSFARSRAFRSMPRFWSSSDGRRPIHDEEPAAAAAAAEDAAEPEAETKATDAGAEGDVQGSAGAGAGAGEDKYRSNTLRLVRRALSFYEPSDTAVSAHPQRPARTASAPSQMPMSMGVTSAGWDSSSAVSEYCEDDDLAPHQKSQSRLSHDLQLARRDTEPAPPPTSRGGTPWRRLPRLNTVPFESLENIPFIPEHMWRHAVVFLGRVELAKASLLSKSFAALTRGVWKRHPGRVLLDWGRHRGVRAVANSTNVGSVADQFQVANVLDATTGTCWISDRATNVAIDISLGATRPVSMIHVHFGTHDGVTVQPRTYVVLVSSDGATFHAVHRVSNVGRSYHDDGFITTICDIRFPERPVRFLKLILTKPQSSQRVYAIRTVGVWGVGDPCELEELLLNIHAGPPHLCWVPFDSTGMPGMVSLLDDC